MYEICIFETDVDLSYFPNEQTFQHIQKPNLGFIHSLLRLNLSLPTDRKIKQPLLHKQICK